MKNYKQIILMVTAVFFIATSCDDELQIDPFESLTTDSSFNSTSDFRLALDGMYSQFIENDEINNSAVYYGAAAMGGLPDILSDNVIITQTGRLSNRNNFEYTYTSINNTGLINEAYEIINLSNIVIERIDNLLASDDKNDILGQSLAIRALCHFDIVRSHRMIPTQNAGANASVGIPYIRFEDGDTGDPFAEPASDTVAQNYADIVADLVQARGLIAADNGESRFNLNAVNALLARVYLYMGEWQNSVNASELVSASLASIADYPGVFTDANDSGVLLKAGQDSQIDNITVGVLWSQSADGNTISEYAIDFDFLQSISTDDVRRNVLSIVAPNNGIDYNAINKVGLAVNGSVDAKLIRMAEVVLTRAEAQFNLGLEGAALATLDELRAVRYSAGAPSGETGQALEDAIQFERRVELAFESHRFFDIKRRGESVTRSTRGDLADGTGTPATELILPAGDDRFQYPIPLLETINNPNFGQNPGF